MSRKRFSIDHPPRHREMDDSTAKKKMRQSSLLDTWLISLPTTRVDKKKTINSPSHSNQLNHQISSETDSSKQTNRSSPMISDDDDEEDDGTVEPSGTGQITDDPGDLYESITQDSQDLYRDVTPSRDTLPDHLGGTLKTALSDPLSLDELTSSPCHSVMIGEKSDFEASVTYKYNRDNVVWLPCSKHSKMAPLVEGDRSRSRWRVIEQAFQHPVNSISELQSAISSYSSASVTLKGLSQYCNDADNKIRFFKTLRIIIKLALKLPYYCRKTIPLLYQGRSHSITFSQLQVASLLANGFLLTFQRPKEQRNSYPDINFSRLYNSHMSPDRVAKLECFLHYFRKVVTLEHIGNVTYSRRCTASFPDWSDYSRTGHLSAYHVSSTGLIEREGESMLQVDFANKFIGGGVLGHGCVQEEIRFAISPELLLSRLFCQCLNDNEAIIISGSEIFCRYKGYSNSFRYLGDYDDVIERDDWNRKYSHVVAIDALRIVTYTSQFSKASITRELNKAYIGFSKCPYLSDQSTVATGNWGCGAFGGDTHLKAFIQILVCSLLRRPICYFTFGDDLLTEDIISFCEFLSDLGDVFSIGQLYALALRYETLSDREKEPYKRSILSFIINEIEKSNELDEYISDDELLAVE